MNVPPDFVRRQNDLYARLERLQAWLNEPVPHNIADYTDTPAAIREDMQAL